MNDSNDRFRVIRVMSVSVDDTTYPSASAASEAASKLMKANPKHEYKVVHTSVPLDGEI